MMKVEIDQLAVERMNRCSAQPSHGEDWSIRYGNPRARIGGHESQWQMADQPSRREGSDRLLHDGRR
jgi:hypothetical protein